MRPSSAALVALALSLSTGVAAGPRKAAEPAPPLGPTPPLGELDTEAGLGVLRGPGSEQVLLRSGTFTMGSSDAEAAHALALCHAEPRSSECRDEWFATEQTAHEVFLSDYWLDRTEVTVSRYRRCVAAGRCALPPYADGAERFDRPDLPVVLVTWSEAARFCAWAGGRLPTEAEWERAARGLAGRRYPWGNVYNPFLSNHGAFALEDLDGRDGFLEIAPVGSFPGGRTPDGLDDLAGNVKEWVSDWYAPEYPKADAADPQGPDQGDLRVVRGGSYVHGRTWLRGAARDRERPGERAPWIGFRCARDARRG
jgi:sulfatase modifying factor 1